MSPPAAGSTASMAGARIPSAWRAGEIAVIGLGKSGRGVATLLARAGLRVYASDAGVADIVRAGAAELRALGVATDEGRHDLERIARAALVVASPGVPPEAPPLARARAAGVPIVSEIEVGLRFLPETRYVAVTGTNGKTTTTAMIGHLFRELGHADAVEAGNIGTALTDIALRPAHPDWISLEVSSFQLHDTPGLEPAVGVLTNLSPDHLDRYASVDEYFADKALLFRNASERSMWVLNRDDEAVMAMARRVPGKALTFSLQDERATAWFDRAASTLVSRGEPILERDELALLGDHNVANALAAWLAVMGATDRWDDAGAWARLAEGLRTFRPLKHRLELVGEYGGVQWINDSKATNVSSTLVAVQGMTRPFVLLLGGRHKGEPYTALAEPFARLGRAVLAYGESGPIVEQDLGGLVPVERLGSDFEAVMRRARELARAGDAVLLSPACSSYDMFQHYEHRGAEFRRLAALVSGAAGEGR